MQDLKEAQDLQDLKTFLIEQIEKTKDIALLDLLSQIITAEGI